MSALTEVSEAPSASIWRAWLTRYSLDAMWSLKVCGGMSSWAWTRNGLAVGGRGGEGERGGVELISVLGH